MTNFYCYKSDNSLHFHFEGRLDSENTHKISNIVEDKINSYYEKKNGEPVKIIFDIEEVDYIASAFIRICIKASKTVGKDNFSLINSIPIIKKTFKVAGLDKALNVS